MTPIQIDEKLTRYLRWLEGLLPQWVEDWSNEVRRAFMGREEVSLRSLDRSIDRYAKALKIYWETGSESVLEELDSRDEPSLAPGAERRLSEFVRVLQIGRRSLIRHLSQSRLSGKKQIEQSLERSFEQISYWYMDRFQARADNLLSQADLSEIQQALPQLKQGKPESVFLQEVLSAIAVGLIVLDRQLNVIWMSPDMPKELLKHAVDNPVGMRCWDVMKTTRNECEACSARAVFHGASSAQFIKEVGETGRVRQYLKITRPIAGNAGEDARVMQIYLDVTREQEAKRSLARAQELVKNILDSSATAIMATDLDGRITLFNKAACKILGYEESRVIGSRISDLYENGEEEARKVMKALWEKEHIYNYETSFRAESGDMIPHYVTASLLRDENGTVTGSMAFAQDRRVEEALKREVATRDQFLFSILQASMDGLITVDSEGNVASWNRGAAMIFGVQAEDAIGRPLEDFLPPDLIQELPVTMILPHGTERFEVQIKRKDGKDLDLLVSRTDIGDGETRERGTSVILKDVTEMKRLQRDFSEAKHLAELGRMAASIAHEIKNPIAGLRGAMEMMSMQHMQGDPRFEIFQEALSQIRRLDSLVKDLLSYAKPVKLNTQPVEVSLILDAVLSQVRDALEQGGVEIGIDLEAGLPAVMADPFLIQQVFVNLIMNAVQAMEGGGRIVLEGQQINHRVILKIEDDGNGIKQSDLAHIFEPFYTTKHIGTGLGLSIVKRILRAHEGDCEVDSEEGRGTTFTIYLPAEQRRS
jgi:PAS domain S-box-containing protein